MGGTVPSQQQLLDNQVQCFNAQGVLQENSALLTQPQHSDTPAAADGSISERPPSLADQYLKLTTPSLMSIGEGLPALPHRLVEKIKAGEYVDFSELPPAKGKGRASSQDWDARVLFLQVQQIENPRCLIPDFPTWAQCFALFAAVKASHQPSLVPDLMAYMVEMAKYAKRFQWPSWVIYDQNFRQEMASRPGLTWSRADPTIFSQCFLGMAKQSAEAWCKYCHSVDHASDLCGEAPRKAPRMQLPTSAATQICRNFNSPRGCSFQLCKYLHKCTLCKGSHSRVQCGQRGGKKDFKENAKPE